MSQHILIVEDDVMIQGFLTLTLEQEGYRTTAVGSGGGMFSVLEHETVDMIIMDLGLPDADGLDLTKEIRKTFTMPIIVASARRTTEDRLSALEFGANDYMTKPFDPRELVLRVRNHLATAAETAQNPQSAASSRERRDGSQPANEPRDRRKAAKTERRGTPTSAAAPAPAPSPTPAPTTPSKSAPRQPSGAGAPLIGVDRTMMVLGGLVIAGFLAGGAFWYYGQENGEDDSMEQAAVSSTPEAERRGALQPPPEQPVRIAKAPEPVSSIPSSTPNSLPKPYTPSLTESVTAKPSLSEPIPAPKPVANSSPSVTVTPPPVPKNWVEASNCPQIPDISWWRVKNHSQVVRYVSRKYGGNWLPYIESWEKRLSKMQDVFQRGSAIKTSTGILLRGVALADYVNDMAARVAVTKCLAKEAKLNNQ